MSLQKKLLIISSLFFTLTFSSAQKRSDDITASKSDSIITSSLANKKEISLTDSIVNYGKLFLNTPYHYGSPGSDTFDCSGFTSFVYRNFGYDLKRSSYDQAQQFDTVNRTQLKKGDLVFFSGRRRSKRVGHVGIVTTANGNGQFEFIHAAVQSGVVISNSEEPYYTNRFIKANRVIDTNPLLTVMPKSTVIADTSRQQKISSPFSIATTQIRKVIPAEYHRVKSGETLSDIAYKYGISLAELKHMNGFKRNKIQIKQQLKVKKEKTLMLVEPVKEIAQISTEKNTKQELNDVIKKDTISTVKIPTTHTVLKGETLFGIAKLYNVSVEELKSLNKNLKGAIKPNQVLILNKGTVFAANNTLKQPISENSKLINKNYKVKKGETLSGVSKATSVSIDELKRINHLESATLKTGQELILSQNGDSTKHQSILKKDIITKNIAYKVKSGESLYSIAKKHKISIDELKKANEIEGNKIKPNQELKIPSTSEFEQNNITNQTESSSKPIIHKVEAGETFSSIAIKYNSKVKNLKEWNNKKDNKIKIGEKLIIRQN